MTLVIIIAALVAKRLTTEIASQSESLAAYADRIAGLYERLDTVATALRDQEKQIAAFLERWSWPNPMIHPGPDPLPPADVDDPTPAAVKPKRKRK